MFTNDATRGSTAPVGESPPGLVPRVNRWVESTVRGNWLGTSAGDACCTFTKTRRVPWGSGWKWLRDSPAWRGRRSATNASPGTCAVAHSARPR
jgi:hypothetical protein